MASRTQTTENRRRRKTRKLARTQKRARARAGTPKFPIHPEAANK